MLGGSEATSEQLSSVCEGVGYDEVYPSGHGPNEGLTWSPEREPSAHSPDDEKEEDYEADGGKEWRGSRGRRRRRGEGR